MRPFYEFFKGFYPSFQCKKRRKDGEITIVLTHELEILYLNETAGCFVEFADGSCTLSEILDKMLEEYEVSKDVLIQDISPVIRDLQWKKLLLFTRTAHE